MNQEIKDEWITDLLSGEYTQGFSRLTAVLPDGTERDCCLGVLCKQAVRKGIIERQIIGDGSKEVEYMALDNPSDRSTYTLPWAVVKWADIDVMLEEYDAMYGTPSNDNPYVRAKVPEGEAARLIPLGAVNDNGVLFPMIADLIREQL